MFEAFRRLAGRARAEQPKPKPDAHERAAMRSAIRADGNSGISPMGGAASPSQTSAAVWGRVIARMSRTN